MSTRRPGCRLTLIAMTCALMALSIVPVSAELELHVEPFHQSPVRVEPGGLLMIPGDGFEAGAVVGYRKLSNTIPTPTPPSLGFLEPGTGTLTPELGTPHALTVRIPEDDDWKDQSYALWVTNDATAQKVTWSKDHVLLNDARPLWVSPAVTHKSIAHPFCEDEAECGRYLKIVGRNLQPAPGEVTRVKLSRVGTFPITVTADPATSEFPQLEEHVARIELPQLTCWTYPCYYTIQVSRDGTSWVMLAGDANPAMPGAQHLEVLNDPPVFPPPPAPVMVNLANCQAGGGTAAECGACVPDDEFSDTDCINFVIANVSASGGGVVKFGSGDWLIEPPTGFDPNPPDGSFISLPVGVSLVGTTTTDAGGNKVRTTALWVPRDAELTYVGGHPPYTRHPPVLMLHGEQTLADIDFFDEFAYVASYHAAAGQDPAEDVFGSGCFESFFLQLGLTPPTGGTGVPDPVRNVVIRNNGFDGMRAAIGAGAAAPIERLYITSNTIVPYQYGLSLHGCNHQAGQPVYSIDDAIIAHNVFKPGPFYDPPHQGSIASSIGAGRRLDFSENQALVSDEGACDQYPRDCKWRANFFWFPTGPQEMVLVSQNHGECSGDLCGDGEFIVFDAAGTDPIFFGLLVPVSGSAADSVSIPSNWSTSTRPEYLGRSTWNLSPEDMTNGATNYSDFFETDTGGFWLMVVRGTGLGQVRRIVDYSLDGGEWTIEVDPPWDVTPVPEDSFISGQRLYRQVQIVANEVDIQDCDKSNPARPASGIIEYHGGFVDSVVAGNRQTEADGIRLDSVAFWDLVGRCSEPDTDCDVDADCDAGFICVSGYCLDTDPVYCSGRRPCETGSTCVTDDGDELIQPYKFSQFRSFRGHGQDANFQYFNDINNNSIETEYDFEEDDPPPYDPECGDDCPVCTQVHCSRSGIRISYAAAWKQSGHLPDFENLPYYPVLTYGISIGHNEIVQADAIRGGAVNVQQTGSNIDDNRTDEAGNPRLHENLLIHNNRISDVKRVTDECDEACVDRWPSYLGGTVDPINGARYAELDPGTGIYIPSVHAQNTVIWNNVIQATCNRIVLPSVFDSNPSVPPARAPFDTTLVIEDYPANPPLCPEERDCLTWDPYGCTFSQPQGLPGYPSNACLLPDADGDGEPEVFDCPEGEIVQLRECNCTDYGGETCPVELGGQVQVVCAP